MTSSKIITRTIETDDETVTVKTYHETINPNSREQVLPIVTTLTTLARAGKITGKIQLNLVQGGVRTIDVENVTETKK